VPPLIAISAPHADAIAGGCELLEGWPEMLTIGVEAGPVPRADLQGLCDIITERLKRLYVIDAGT
jgi:hypothetical protein